MAFLFWEGGEKNENKSFDVCFSLLFFTIALLSTPQSAKAKKYKIINLGTLWGEYTYVYGINNAGQVVGFSTNEQSNPAHAFLWENGNPKIQG